MIYNPTKETLDSMAMDAKDVESQASSVNSATCHFFIGNFLLQYKGLKGFIF